MSGLTLPSLSQLPRMSCVSLLAHIDADEFPLPETGTDTSVGGRECTLCWNGQTHECDLSFKPSEKDENFTLVVALIRNVTNAGSGIAFWLQKTQDLHGRKESLLFPNTKEKTICTYL